MTLSEFRPTLLAKSVGRTALPPNEDLKARIFAGLKLIAKETIPLRLVTTTTDGYTILRRLDDSMYVRMPMIPTNEDSEIDIDLALIDALAYYIMAGLERSNANVHMGMYHGEIDMNNDRLTETYLSDSTNGSCRFCIFP